MPLPVIITGAAGFASLLVTVVARQRERALRAADPWIAATVTAGLVAWSLALHDPETAVSITGAFLTAGVPLAILDVRTLRLPNWLILTAAALVACTLAALVIGHATPALMARAGLGALVFFVFYAALYVLLPGQLGGGDVKLAGLTGTVLGSSGWPAILGGLLVIWALAAAATLVTIAVLHSRPNLNLPHGPWLVLGAAIPALLPA